MDQNSTFGPSETTANLPTRDELQAELLDIPEPPEQPAVPVPPGQEDLLAAALRYVRGKRGGDLLAVILVGSGARRALTPHSRSEEHTSELQSRFDLVCRLLLEKKK